MRKKFLLTLAAILAATIAAFCFTACGGNGGSGSGDNGGTGGGDNPSVEHTHSYVDGVCTVCGYEKLEEATGLAYTLSDDGSYYIVTGIGTEERTKFAIPATYNGKPVKEIGEKAFSRCSSLTNVTIGNGVTSIGSIAFEWCDSLTSVTIGDSVTSIGDNAFSGCSSLASVTIPDSVTSIGNGAFWFCSSLTSITVAKDNANYKSIDGNLYSKDGKTLIQYAIGKNDTSFTIPDSVTSIGSGAFYACMSLTSIAIPNSVTSIDDGAFYACISLMSIVIPDSVTSIGDYAFYSCFNLTSIVIPDSVTSIGDYAFYGCYKLVEVINNSSLNITKGSSDNGYVAGYALNVKNGGTSEVVNKDGYLFYTCDNVNYLIGYVGTDTELTLPNDYNGASYKIYHYAFAYCDSLTSVTIGNGVTSIGEGAFGGCSNLTSIEFKGTKAQWKAIEKDSYWKEYTGDFTVHCTDGDLTEDEA